MNWSPLFVSFIRLALLGPRLDLRGGGGSGRT